MLYRNKKKGTIYNLLDTCINCTNAQDGQQMFIYTNGQMTFCREEKEFEEKFEQIESLSLIDLLTITNITSSIEEAKHLIENQGVKLNGKKVNKLNEVIRISFGHFPTPLVQIKDKVYIIELGTNLKTLFTTHLIAKEDIS